MPAPATLSPARCTRQPLALLHSILLPAGVLCPLISFKRAPLTPRRSRQHDTRTEGGTSYEKKNDTVRWPV